MGLKKSQSKNNLNKNRTASQPHKFNSVSGKIEPIPKRAASQKNNAPRSTTMKVSTSSKTFGQPFGVPRKTETQAINSINRARLG